MDLSGSRCLGRSGVARFAAEYFKRPESRYATAVGWHDIRWYCAGGIGGDIRIDCPVFGAGGVLLEMRAVRTRQGVWAERRSPGRRQSGDTGDRVWRRACKAEAAVLGRWSGGAMTVVPLATKKGRCIESMRRRWSCDAQRWWRMRCFRG